MNNFIYPKDINKRIRDLKTKEPLYWEKLAQKKLDNFIKFVIKNVSAYRQFLKDNGINFKKINGFKNLKELPIMDKNNYLRKYPYLDLFPNRNIFITSKFSATSGSTGEPFYFPRGENLDEQYQYVMEINLKNQWEIDKLKTLVIVSFGLGIWIGGMYTYKIFEKLAEKGYKIITAPVGTYKELVIKTFKKMANLFDQVIIVGYPPFVKDLVDEGEILGVNWKNSRIRILNAAEGFSENFRKYIGEKFGLRSLINDNINIYGSVELGAMGTETVFANLIRSIAVEKDKVFKAIFEGKNRLPTLAQYHPYIVYFEEVDGLIVASGYGESIPLLRYGFADRGGIIPFDEMINRLKSAGVDIFKEAEKYKIKDKILKLPFVYVYERSDFAVSLVGILIYPEYIKVALLSKNIQKYLTGKFSMQVDYDKKMNQKLKIHIELQKGIKENKNLQELVKKEIINSLIKYSTEYNHLYATGNKNYKKQLEPEIYFHLYEDPQYFRPGIKQKWSIK